jgi:hypothetical protein
VLYTRVPYVSTRRGYTVFCIWVPTSTIYGIHILRASIYSARAVCRESVSGQSSRISPRNSIFVCVSVKFSTKSIPAHIAWYPPL